MIYVGFLLLNPNKTKKAKKPNPAFSSVGVGFFSGYTPPPI